jgi:hypothetical protein
LHSVQLEVRKSLIDLESKLDHMQTQIDNVHAKSCNKTNLYDDMHYKDVSSRDLCLENGPISNTPDNDDSNNNGPNSVTQITPFGKKNSNTEDYSRQFPVNTQGTYSMSDVSNSKMKTQTYNGSDDLDEYLVHFKLS